MIRFALGILCTSLSSTVAAAVNDIYPSDYTSLPPGMTTVSIYSYYRQAENYYHNGKKQLDGKLDIPIAAVRYTRFMKLGGFTVAPIVVVSWSGINASPDSLSGTLGKNAHGLGDLRIGGTLWLIENSSKREYFGVTGMVIAPTGEYKKENLLNIGENRWRYVLGAGWIEPLGERVLLEVLPEVAWYGENDSYLGGNKLEQDPSYSLGANLRYRVSPKLELFSGAQLNRGGGTSINEADQHNPPKDTRISLGTNYLTENQGQWIFRYSRDIAIENGFKTKHELALRYLVYF